MGSIIKTAEISPNTKALKTDICKPKIARKVTPAVVRNEVLSLKLIGSS